MSFLSYSPISLLESPWKKEKQRLALNPVIRKQKHNLADLGMRSKVKTKSSSSATDVRVLACT